MPPMRHCHHCKHNPLLTPTSDDLWTDDMNKDTAAACEVNIKTADVRNFMNKKHGINCSHAKILKMKWQSLAKNHLKIEANSTEQLQHLMDNRQSQFALNWLLLFFFNDKILCKCNIFCKHNFFSDYNNLCNYVFCCKMIVLANTMF